MMNMKDLKAGLNIQGETLPKSTVTTVDSISALHVDSNKEASVVSAKELNSFTPAENAPSTVKAFTTDAFLQAIGKMLKSSNLSDKDIGVVYSKDMDADFSRLATPVDDVTNKNINSRKLR